MDASDDEDEKIAKELAQKLSSRPDLSNDAHEPRHLREKLPKPSRERKRWKDVASFTTMCLLFVAIALGKDFSPPETLPLKAKQLTHLKQFQGKYREERLWGTYRPGLYFGMRTREVETLQTGLMWFDPDAQPAMGAIRHQAEDRDGLQGFGWERHDGRTFGRQELYDGNMHLTTSFAKRFCTDCRGGDWAVRVHLEPKHPTQNAEVAQRGSVIFYIASSDGEVDILDGQYAQVVQASGSSYPFGSWKMTAPARGRGLPSLHLLSLQTSQVHNLTDAIRREISRASFTGQARSGQGHLTNVLHPHANVALFQYTGVLPMTMDFVFTGSLSRQGKASLRQRWSSFWRRFFKVAEDRPPAWPEHRIAEKPLADRIKALSGEQLSSLLAEREREFNAEFETKFGDLDTLANSEGTAEAAKAALSNMLGSVGYFYGTSDIQLGSKVVQSKPHPLLAAVPSRSFFPRGFLWDEGFHQLLLRKWDPKLSRDILGHWLDLINSEGWMASEQILGEEARSRVPSDFIVQSLKAANPPTLFLSFADLAKELAGKMHSGKFKDPQPSIDDQEKADFLRAAFPRLKAWIGWYMSTQKGELENSWRWRGRTMEYLSNPFTGDQTEYTKELNPKTLTSGLDDYPRASHPSKEERHVDLYCWMAFAANTMTTIGRTLKIKAHKYGPIMLAGYELSNTTLLKELHYDASAKQFRDWGLHTEDVRLDTWYAKTPEVFQGQRLPEHVANQARPMGLARFVDSPPSLRFVPHYGYVSLFPLMMRMLESDSPELLAQLHHLRHGGILTPFGLRSLGNTSTIHGKRNTEHDAPYWRGPIWMNINYLVLSSLKHYSQGTSESAMQAKQMYTDLRSTLLKLTVEGYRESGFLWENYDEDTGSGRGCRPFTGWSALMVLIASDDLQ